MAADGGTERRGDGGGERLLFLTDEQLRQAAELMFFAYRAFTQDPDEILAADGFGRAHHRALHFIASKHGGGGGADAGATVSELIETLGVTKQSLNRVLRELVEKGLVEQRVGEKDRRQRRLSLTTEGRDLERRLAESQAARLRRAFREAGPDAVVGFRTVLERMLDPERREDLVAFVARRHGVG